MKRIITLFLIVIFIFSLCSCGKLKENNSINNLNTDNENTAIKEEKIECTSHNFIETVISDATCIQSGLKRKTCSICGYNVDLSVSAVGHTWKNATCQQPKTCTICGVTEGNISEHISNSNGICNYCGANVLITELEQNISVYLIIPSIGTNNYMATIKIVNHSKYSIELNKMFFCNGKGCHGNIEKGYILNSNMQIAIKAYRSIIPEDRFEEKYRDMYLDNNSTANSSVYVNGQLLHMKFDVNGNVRFSANPNDLGIY